MLRQYYLNLCITLLALLFFLSGCSCGCVWTIPQIQDNSTVTTSQVTVFADGCGSTDGSVDANGVTNLYCGTLGSNGYNNQGNWVQAPNVSVGSQSYLTVNIYGSVYYCSTGYDIKNPSPTFIVKPGTNPSNLFADGSEMIVSPGQSIVIANSSNGAIIGNNSNVQPCPGQTSASYQSFIAGGCQGTNALGLTIYLNNTELVTLDATNQSDTSTQFGTYQARMANLFAYVSPADLNGYTDTTGIFQPGVITQYNNKYQSALSANWALGQYQFIVPPTAQAGTLGFSIAQATGAPSGGFGNYILTVYSTPPACYVNASLASTQPGERGALQMYIGNANPNQIQQITSDFDALDANAPEISIYYPQLLSYIAQNAGVSINNNAAVLSDLVVSPSPSISPVVITTSTMSGVPYSSGSIWFLVRDDYYHDNVGEYQVALTITNPTNSEVSSFLQSLIDPIVSQLNSFTTLIYTSIYENTQFIGICRLALILYIALLGAQYTLGLHQISSQDLVVRGIKIGVIVTLLAPGSWDFFNQYLFSLFTTGNDYLIGAATGDTSTDKVYLFSFIDDAFNIFFQNTTWLRISALLLDFIGFICIPMLIYVIITYLIIMAKVLISYLICVAMIAILLSIAPIFIIMILFERTKGYFDGWIKQLVDFALQSTILFTAFYFISKIFVNMWLNVVNYNACWGGAVNLYLDLNLLTGFSTNLLPKISLGCIQWYTMANAADIYYLTIQCLALVILVNVIRGMISHVPSMTSAITGQHNAHKVDNLAVAMEKDTKDAAKYTAKTTANVAVGLVEKTAGAAMKARGGTPK